MPYRRNADLPPSVRDHLHEHAQDIFRAAFNNVWDESSEEAEDEREERAFRIGSAAVKRGYEKRGARWTRKPD